MTDSQHLEIKPAWIQAAQAYLGCPVSSPQPLDGGEEAEVFRLRAGSRDVVLHLSPAWRTQAELEWVHGIVHHVHSHVAQAVAPIFRNGDSVVEVEGRCITLFPFVEGVTLDRDNPSLRAEAAGVLAIIHQTLLGWKGVPRPSSAAKPMQPADPPEIEDPRLDAWWNAVREHGLVTAPTHGDYYRRNLLCRDDHIVGVIDWHDADIRSLALELAGAVFELCRNDDHDLDIDRARSFVDTYRTAGGPVPDHELGQLQSFMRVWVRQDARGSLACAPVSQNLIYLQKQIRAFHSLARVQLDWA